MPKLEQTSKSSQVNWHVYMIRADDNSLYTGVTTDVERRFNEHQSNPKLAAKYFRARKAISLEYSYETQSKKLAYQLEYRIKRLTKSVKEELVAGKVKVEDIIEI
ncbi:GIY-YIG nuclease family protein [Catenovulum agarivorans]|uniref:GIY-YIG nuclease family protein n=1 Tax=Catenovulum agarivorans TaxID=1172192 RepID=UPI0002D8E867|nr:GIY-YIG nuclease family protein [Catenovulum agarivorans]